MAWRGVWDIIRSREEAESRLRSLVPCSAFHVFARGSFMEKRRREKKRIGLPFIYLGLQRYLSQKFSLIMVPKDSSDSNILGDFGESDSRFCNSSTSIFLELEQAPFLLLEKWRS
ncbi:unnamed protein product [Victoria cruziana]